MKAFILGVSLVLTGLLVFVYEQVTGYWTYVTHDNGYTQLNHVGLFTLILILGGVLILFFLPFRKWLLERRTARGKRTNHPAPQEFSPEPSGVLENLPIIRCECGAEILLVPDLAEMIVPNLAEMARIIEDHANTHRANEQTSEEQDLEIARIRENLIQQMWRKASHIQ
jgi:hypothetical protein